MRKYLTIPPFVICLLYLGCSKSGQPNPKNNGGSTSGIKIEIVSGNNQTDTIGYPLPNPVTVKVTQNGKPLSNYGVVYRGSGCNEDRLDTTTTKADGTSQYSWWLAGDIGQQSLKVIAIDAQNRKVDSVTVAGTGIAPGAGGWHYSACTYPFATVVSSFCKLSTGRIYATFSDENAYLRYSDDNGISWYSVKNLGNNHNIPPNSLFILRRAFCGS